LLALGHEMQDREFEGEGCALARSEMLLSLDQALRDLRELIQRESLRLCAQLGRHLLAHGLGRVAGRAREHERAGVFDRAADKETEVASVVDEAADELHALRSIRSGERIKKRRGLLPVRRAEQVVDFLQRDGSIGERDDHVQHALGIAKGALRVARDRIERSWIGAELLLLDDVRELRDHALVRNAAEVEALRARNDRGRDLLRLGRRQDEHRVRRWLLERLQERVERLGRELVRLVDHVHLVLPHGRSKTDFVAEIAHLIDAAIRGCVYLDEVEEAAFADGDARLAAIARLSVFRVRAVHGLRDKPGDRRLSGPSDPREKVRVGDLATRDRVPERARDVLLSHDGGEGLWSVTPLESGALWHAPE